MTAKAKPATAPPEEDDLRHYTPEELVDPEGEFRIPCAARTLRELAYARKVPSSKAGGRVTFTRPDIRGVSEYYAVPAVADARRA